MIEVWEGTTDREGKCVCVGVALALTWFSGRWQVVNFYSGKALS